MSKCDYCGRENADNAATCAECGTELPRAPGTPPPVPAPPAKNTASRHMMLGVFWFLGGSAVTIGSYAVSNFFGGWYLVAKGAILWGLAEFIYGFINRKKSSDQLERREAEDAAYEALAEGARLEAQGQQAAALALYQKIAELHPDTPVGWDALASIKNLRPPVT